MKITALYSRVSTLEQAKEGYSIHAQKEKLEAYAKAKGLNDIKHYSDGGFSGSSLDRPAMQNLIQEAESDNISTVICFKLDRISRSQKDTLTLVQDLFNKKKIDFISLEENIDTSTPMGITMIGIMSAFAELERSNIRERMSMGREERAKRGYYHGGGNYNPLGYDYEDGLLYINHYEKEIVEDIFQTYIDGNSMNKTARMMRAKYPDRIKSDTIVRDTLGKKLYTGYVTFNGNVYKGKQEPIIDMETFQKAQKIRKKRSVKTGHTNERKGLLVGNIYCAHCGARYHREVSGSRKYRYVNYVCYSQRRSKTTAHMIKDPNCKNKRWKEHELDRLVISHLQNLSFDTFDEEESREKERIEQKQDQIKRLNGQKKRLIDLYTMDLIDQIELKEKTDQVKSEIEQLNNDIEDIRTEPNKEQVITNLRTFNWEKSDKKQQIALIDDVVDYIEIDDSKVYTYLNF